eukprot:760924-Hanusia_phi.AAC.4
MDTFDLLRSIDIGSKPHFILCLLASLPLLSPLCVASCPRRLGHRRQHRTANPPDFTRDRLRVGTSITDSSNLLGWVISPGADPELIDSSWGRVGQKAAQGDRFSSSTRLRV